MRCYLNSFWGELVIFWFDWFFIFSYKLFVNFLILVGLVF